MTMWLTAASPRGRYNPIKTIKTSFIGTMNMLGLAKRTKARFLLTSTSEVYGDPLVHPQVRLTLHCARCTLTCPSPMPLSVLPTSCVNPLRGLPLHST